MFNGLFSNVTKFGYGVHKLSKIHLMFFIKFRLKRIIAREKQSMFCEEETIMSSFFL